MHGNFLQQVKQGNLFQKSEYKYNKAMHNFQFCFVTKLKLPIQKVDHFNGRIQMNKDSTICSVQFEIFDSLQTFIIENRKFIYVFQGNMINKFMPEKKLLISTSQNGLIYLLDINQLIVCIELNYSQNNLFLRSRNVNKISSDRNIIYHNNNYEADCFIGKRLNLNFTNIRLQGEDQKISYCFQKYLSFCKFKNDKIEVSSFYFRRKYFQNMKIFPIHKVQQLNFLKNKVIVNLSGTLVIYYLSSNNGKVVRRIRLLNKYNILQIQCCNQNDLLFIKNFDRINLTIMQILKNLKLIVIQEIIMKTGIIDYQISEDGKILSILDQETQLHFFEQI